MKNIYVLNEYPPAWRKSMYDWPLWVVFRLMWLEFNLVLQI